MVDLSESIALLSDRRPVGDGSDDTCPDPVDPRVAELARSLVVARARSMHPAGGRCHRHLEVVDLPSHDRPGVDGGGSSPPSSPW